MKGSVATALSRTRQSTLTSRVWTRHGKSMNSSWTHRAFEHPFTNPKPKETNVMSSLSNRAILVDLDISQWSARKLDKRETDEVLLRNGASRRAARVNKSLLPGAQSLEAVMKKATEIRTWFYERTLPWSGSARILRSDAYFDFVQELNSHVAAYEQRVDDFV